MWGYGVPGFSFAGSGSRHGAGSARVPPCDSEPPPETVLDVPGMTRVSPTVAQFEFAARVRRQRESEGIPAQEVSDRLGFSRNSYSAIENSHRLLTLSKLGPLLDVLNFDADQSQAPAAK